MYFVNEQHKLNFEQVCERWPLTRNNSGGLYLSFTDNLRKGRAFT